jgi:hypothetical protein
MRFAACDLPEIRRFAKTLQRSIGQAAVEVWKFQSYSSLFDSNEGGSSAKQRFFCRYTRSA